MGSVRYKRIYAANKDDCTLTVFQLPAFSFLRNGGFVFNQQKELKK